MNPVYFIHLVLARLSRRQAFGVVPKAGKLVWRHSIFWSSLAFGMMSVTSFGCVGTRLGSKPHALRGQVVHQERDLPPRRDQVRTGLFARATTHEIVGAEHDCYSASELPGPPAPRESLVLPWLKNDSRSHPPQPSRFLPVPTRPVFDPHWGCDQALER